MVPPPGVVTLEVDADCATATVTGSGFAPAAMPGNVASAGGVAVDGVLAVISLDFVGTSRFVWVSVRALASGFGADAAGDRSTMVFSKSALVVIAGVSLTYLSLYLPISMMSLPCKKCFFTGWPLTKVPLVLPRSSRKESLRIVIITACSPLIAKLSI